MSASIKIETDESRSPVGWKQVFTWRWCALFLVLGSHLPLVSVLAVNVAEFRPHYEFAPLLITAVAWLVWQRWPAESAQDRSWRPRSVLLFGWVMLAVAVVFYSPWLATAALMFSLAGCIWQMVGRRAARDLAPGWFVLWLAIPAPLKLDEWLTLSLQSYTSRISSLVLDLFGVLHSMEGNVLVLVQGRLFVEEACSGVNSQFVLLSATAFIAAYQRLPLIQSLLLMLSSVLWAAAVNVGRVITIALVRDSYDLDLSSGWAHETLGYLLVILALGLILSTGALLAFALGPIRYGTGTGKSSRQRLQNWLSRTWNRVFEMPKGAVHSDAATGSPGNVGRSTVKGFVVLASIQLAVVAAPRPDMVEPTEVPWETATPADVLTEWELEDFEEVERDRQNSMGRFSKTWLVKRDSRRCAISVDYPFNTWHELSGCYLGQGWEIRERELRSDEDGTFVRVLLTKPTGEMGLLFFSNYGIFGNRLSPENRYPDGGMSQEWIGQTVALRLTGHPIRSWLEPENPIRFPGTTWQLQRFEVLRSTPDDSLLMEAEQEFLQISDHFQQLWARASAGVRE